MIYDKIISTIKKQYLADNMPWVVAYSGGKDSTTVLQMIFYALGELPKDKLTKEIHVLSNDTLVENPVIISTLDKQLASIKKAGKTELFSHNPKLFNVVKTKPILKDTFWVNLIGKGYPSPNRWFRWCTQRMKINPTSEYVKTTANKNGKAIIILGTRKAESANRAVSMNHYNNGKLLREHSLPNVYVFAPIADLTNDDVWVYLNQVPNPWGYDNKKLITLYRNASGECPLVLETGTQSCGNSRFGCWTCTVVRKDQSLENLIDNGNEWMQELLDFRNLLAKVRLQDEQYIPNRVAQKVKFGPFLLKTRRELLEKLIEIQNNVNHGTKLIYENELTEVKRILDNDYKKEKLKKYIIKLANGLQITIISDFNPLKSTRTRIGKYALKGAKLIKIEKASEEYKNSTRVIYY